MNAADFVAINARNTEALQAQRDRLVGDVLTCESYGSREALQARLDAFDAALAAHGVPLAGSRVGGAV